MIFCIAYSESSVEKTKTEGGEESSMGRRGLTILNRMVSQREGGIWQKPNRAEGSSHAAIWGKTFPDVHNKMHLKMPYKITDFFISDLQCKDIIYLFEATVFCGNTETERPASLWAELVLLQVKQMLSQGGI